jgi:hypothetical protein
VKGSNEVDAGDCFGNCRGKACREGAQNEVVCCVFGESRFGASASVDAGVWASLGVFFGRI